MQSKNHQSFISMMMPFNGIFSYMDLPEHEFYNDYFNVFYGEFSYGMKPSLLKSKMSFLIYFTYKKALTQPSE